LTISKFEAKKKGGQIMKRMFYFLLKKKDLGTVVFHKSGIRVVTIFLSSLLVINLIFTGLVCAADPTERSQARSMVISQYGVAATEHPLASKAATRILEKGGNAIDAAIAANAMMGVVAPMMNGIGGDLFAIVYEAKSGKLYGLNASGAAPAGLTIDYLKAKGLKAMPQIGIDSVSVPGTVEGWDMLRARFGTKPFKELLAPAIAVARSGFPIAELSAQYWGWGWVQKNLQSDPVAAALYLPNGKAPGTGEIFRNPELAATLEQIAQDGKKAFYNGAIANRIIKASNRLGGQLKMSDLQSMKGEWVEPISTQYRGWTVYELPPNTQGMGALMMLNMMEGLDLRAWGHNSTQSLHHLIEIKKLVYADMLLHDADPKFSKIPVTELISKGYAQTRGKLVNPNLANCNVAPSLSYPKGSDTTYLSIVDKDGNMVSLIQSVYNLFGASVGVDGAGFVLHNRAGLFSLDPSHPNALAGGKRPVHTIIPGFMSRGEQRIAFGIMGGWNQALAHAQFVSNIVDFGMNIQSALEAARFTKWDFEGCGVHVEARMSKDTMVGLSRKGHQLYVDGDFSGYMGGGQAVLRDFAKGINYGASDARKDGLALPEMKD
jgi:gamma-glutamyltranspeptidase/glutathione hydrolase